MPDAQALDPAAHADLRINDVDQLAWRGFVELMVDEFVAAAAYYPLFLSKRAETGRFAAGLLHGIPSDYGDFGGPKPRSFVPAALAREGFYAVGTDLAVDLDHGRISRCSGERLFGPDGTPTPALQVIQQAVATLKFGRDATQAFVDALLINDLVEPAAITLDFDNGQRFTFDGLYTVSLDRLARLGDAQVLTLFRPGYLQLAYCLSHSLSQLPILAARCNGF